MAIWPFSRKGKRPRSQITGPESTEKTTLFSSSHAPEQSSSLLGRKPSRKRSKRHKGHVATRASDADFGYSASPVPIPVPQAPPWLERGQSSSGAPPEPMLVRGQRGDRPSLSFWDHPENHTSLSSLDQDQINPFSRSARRQKRRNDPEREGGGPWRRLSKRSARDMAREQEILLMSSSPPSDPVRPPPKHERHVSVLSLTMRDSARSSMSDSSDTGTFRIHGLAVFTPRPALRYAETSRYVVPRSQGPSAASEKRPMWQDQDGSSRKRVAELADDLDAPALRELLERDRRRKEKKRQEEQERLQRRLQRRADRQREEERRAARSGQMVEGEEGWRGRTPLADASIPSPPHPGAADSVAASQRHPDPLQDSRATSAPKAEVGSWLRDSSKEGHAASHRMSNGSTRMIETLDNDSSIRASHSGNLGAPDSGVAWSPARTVSHDACSRSQGSLSASQLLGGARGSTSDISRTGDSDKRLSDASGKRHAGWSSFFRRASFRRKRNSVDHGRTSASDFSNTSRESFSRLQSQSGPPPPIPERNFIRTSGLRHTQSKFTEHLGDQPISPSDSHIQSPTLEVPETVVDMSPDPDEMNLDERDSTSPISFSNGERSSRHRSWETNSPRASPENAFSQSLASIDSEGSWMSGKYLRHLSQAANNSVRRSGGSTTNKTDPVDENLEFEEGDDVTSDEYLARLAAGTLEQPHDSPTEVRRASSSAMGPDSDQRSGVSSLPDSVHENKPEEKRRVENDRRRPRLVRPGMQPEDVTMKQASPDSYTTSPTEEGTPVEIQRATSIDFGQQHARRISAGSAKLLDIPARASIDSKPLSAESTVVGDMLESDHFLGK
ncbi:hypothetical protein V8E54_004317 [Elaphomyces granulatus]